MNPSQYIEKMVIKRKDKRDYAMMAALPFAAALVIFAILKFLPMRFLALAAAMVVVIGYAMYYAIKMIYVEYEYEITLGDMDIDSIRGQKKRVRVYSGALSQLEEMAPYNANDNMSAWDSIPDRVEAVSDLKAEDIYYFIGAYKGKRTLVLFQPSHEMLAVCQKYMGRKLTLRPGDQLMVSTFRDEDDEDKPED